MSRDERYAFSCCFAQVERACLCLFCAFFLFLTKERIHFREKELISFSF